MENEKNILLNEGTLLDLEGNKPFLLDDEESVWIVHSGVVDIFVVKSVDGKQVGSRNHLFRAEAGQTLFGIDCDKHGREIKILASPGSDTRLLKLDKERLRNLSLKDEFAGEIAELMDSWVSVISSGIITGDSPTSHKNLSAADEVCLDEAQVSSTEEGVVWVKLLEGEMNFIDQKTLLLKPADSYFPVSILSWLRAATKSRICILDTPIFLKDNTAWKSFDQFHKIVIDCIALNLEQTEEREKTRLKNRSENDRFYMKSAITRLSEILKIGAARIPFGDIDDPLFRACQLVGRTIGIEMKPHPDLIRGVKVLNPLRAILDASRVRSRIVILKGEWWKTDIGGPILAFKEKENRPVAIIPVTSTAYKMYDPVDDHETPVTAEVASLLKPAAHTFYRHFPDKKLSGMDLLKFGIHGLQSDIYMVLSMGLAAGLLALIVPIATGKIFDTIIPGAERGQLFQLTIALIVFAFATSMFQIVRGIAMIRIEGKMDSSVQSAVWDRLLSLPVPFFSNYSTGDLAQRAMGINLIRQAASGVVVQSILGLLSASFSFCLLFYYNVKMAFVGMGIVFLAFSISATLGYFKMYHQRRLSQIQGKISGMVLQFISGINKIRIASAENRIYNLWSKEFSEQKKARFNSQSLANWQAVFNISYPVIASITIFFFLYHFNQSAIEKGESNIMSTGDFLAFNSAFSTFLMALLGVTEVVISTLNVIPVYERSKPIFETLPEVDSAKADPGTLSGAIEINQINFQYTKDGPVIIDNISLNIRSGEYCAMVGSSGSGKSTLFRILLGFEALSSGTIYYDGHDLSKLDVRAVRRQLGVVLQSGKIIAGDIFTNIIGSLQLTIDDAWEAARRAGFEQDIKDMPMGMHTVLNEGASTLSGGQRQRLMIARAIVHKPRIVYFDEATSALDNETQAIVSKSLDNLKVTRVVIAHRLSTIINADRIFVIDKGKLVQEGSYDELIKQEGLFAELAKRQIA